MHNSKKKRDKAERKRELRRQREPSTRIDASSGKPDIHREIRYVTQLARAEDARLVTLGNLVLFSTRTRDAWLLDREDDFALCLCRMANLSRFGSSMAPTPLPSSGWPTSRLKEMPSSSKNVREKSS